METSDSLIDALVRIRRTIEQAHADLVAKFARAPSPELARMIGQLGLEIAERSPAAVSPTLDELRSWGNERDQAPD
jgi:hypothetical protein